MEKLRVVAECWPPNIYYDSLPNGTEWHGNGMWTLQEMRALLPPIEVVTNLSKSEDTFDAIQTLHDNRADMSTDKWGITHERSKLVDFSYSLKVYGTYLYSGASGAKNGPINGVFDDASYALFLVTLVLFILLSWAAKALEVPGFRLSTAVTYMFGSSVNQGLCGTMMPRSTAFKNMMCLFVVFNALVCIMYSSVMISKLTSPAEFRGINSLEDLLQPSNQHLRIWVKKFSFIEDNLEAMEIYPRLVDPDLRSRVDFYEEPKTGRGAFNMDILSSVLNGSHILIAANENLDSMLEKIYSDTQTCNIRMDEFSRSRDSIFSTTTAWLYRKNFPLHELINYKLMWLEAFGIENRVMERHNKLNRKGKGVWSDDVMDRACPKNPESEDVCDTRRSSRSTRSSEDGLQVLKFKHFKHTFQILGGMLAIATLIFLFEIAGKDVPLKKKKNKVVPYNVF